MFYHRMTFVQPFFSRKVLRPLRYATRLTSVYVRLQGRRQYGPAQIGCPGRHGAHIDGGGAAEVSRQQISGDFGTRQK